MTDVACKTCKACQQAKPLAAFGKLARARDGRLGTCTACKYERRTKDPAKDRARTIRWRANNRERHRELRKAEQRRRRTRVAEREGRVYRSREQRVAEGRAREAARRDAVRARRDQKAEHRAAAAVDRPWLAAGLSDAETYRLRYRSDPAFAEKERQRIYASRTRSGRHFLAALRRGALRWQRKSRKLALLGYTFEQLRSHLEDRFTSGMDWPAFAAGRLHIDFVVPVVAYDVTRADWEREAFALSNLQPLWAEDNLAKADRLPDGTLGRYRQAA